jgi:hypothetical protein
VNVSIEKASNEGVGLIGNKIESSFCIRPKSISKISGKVNKNFWENFAQRGKL